MFTALNSTAGLKRGRDADDEPSQNTGPYSKKSRPTTTAAASGSWHDSVIDTPTGSSQKPKYDSDDQSSMMSEPGSPQDLDQSSADDMEVEMEDAAFSQSPEESFVPGLKGPLSSSPWRERVQSRDRVATPFGAHPRTSAKPLQVRTGVKQHIRRRHPQVDNSDHLEVPSPIDEDEVPTPPSAAEAAGSQLSMLSVSDMDIEPSADLPSITIDPASRSLQLDGRPDSTSPGLEVMGGMSMEGMVRKQRQRSGAQSNGSVSPVRPVVDREMDGMGQARRGISIGYRADCMKCQMRVPGHMNHFTV
ncbi:hypothetical protein BAUCODRAFT_264283 [Baudoinia panamericana UAMH 10762]|uniref:Uncharacterized protein n=1 Tax=Baudoinia panamericana (strain UAMH 10762) TaxID=717646 RepID=M2LFN0_BAUPA|nr:uncharacterized protein BAUCODRAFT_264283 [Baudoinia panamericana UAMH 10762]EMC92852.1 hypothetical protein BAUCODRAFT_264283 [Baudoinia panamericana UAMH 10762]